MMSRGELPVLIGVIALCILDGCGSEEKETSSRIGVSTSNNQLLVRQHPVLKPAQSPPSSPVASQSHTIASKSHKLASKSHTVATKKTSTQVASPVVHEIPAVEAVVEVSHVPKVSTLLAHKVSSSHIPDIVPEGSSSSDTVPDFSTSSISEYVPEVSSSFEDIPEGSGSFDDNPDDAISSSSDGWNEESVPPQHPVWVKFITALVNKKMQAAGLTITSKLGVLKRNESDDGQILQDLGRTGFGSHYSKLLCQVLFKFVDATIDEVEHGYTQGQHIVAERLLRSGFTPNVTVDMLRFFTTARGLGTSIEGIGREYLPFFVEGDDIFRIMSKGSIDNMREKFDEEGMDIRIRGFSNSLYQLLLTMFSYPAFSDEAWMAFVKFVLINGRPGVLALSTAILENWAGRTVYFRQFGIELAVGMNHALVQRRASEILEALAQTPPLL